VLRRRRHLEKLPFAEIKHLLEIRRVRISGATLMETRQIVLSADRLKVNVQKLIIFFLIKIRKTKKKRKKPDLTRSSCRALPLYFAIVKDRFFGVLAVRNPVTEYNSQSNHNLPWLRIEVSYSFQKLVAGVCASYKRYERAVAVPVAKKKRLFGSYLQCWDQPYPLRS